jgi:hypothetical protein
MRTVERAGALKQLVDDRVSAVELGEGEADFADG